MDNKGYFSSHNHSHFSNFRLLDSVNRPEHLFERALEIGLTGFAITDHESLSAHVEVMKIRDEMKKKGTLPQEFTIGFGNEAYLVDELGMGIKYYHWLVIAKDKKGHEVLRKLSSQAWDNAYVDRGMQRVPITKDQVKEIMEKEGGKGHLIVTSACLGGELGSNALAIKKLQEEKRPGFEDKVNEHKQRMVDYVRWNVNVFGKDNFFIELAPNINEQVFANEMLFNLAKGYGLRAIFATDSHYLTKEDQAIHRAFLNSQDGEREVDEFYSTAYMMDLEEIWEFLRISFTREEFLEMRENLEYMRNMIDEYDLHKEQIVPRVEVRLPSTMHPVVDESYLNMNKLLVSTEEQDVYWMRTCLNELYKRGKWNEQYLDTLENEAEVIVEVSKRMGQSMAAYYNTAQKLIEIMWTKGDSLVGASRGSAMAFLSNWLLDITQIDPIPYEIPFWRHLSKSRPELPDIDIDAEGFKREKIIEAIKEEFGEDRVLNIATYGTEGSRSALATAARGLGVSDDIASYLGGLIPNERGFDWTLSDVVYGNEEKGRYPISAFKEEISKYEGFLETALSIEGMVTSRGSHAAGVYIFNDNYTSQNAMMKTSKGLPITQWDMGESDHLGGVKFDFLSIEALDKIRAAMNLLIQDGLMEDKGSLKETYDHYLHPDNLDYSEEMWKDAWEGKVLDLFQFQTPVGGEAIKKGRPRNVLEGAALNSLMRLMPMEDGTVPTNKFVEFKEDISLWYNEMERAGVPQEEVEILERHYLQSKGVPNTQEELMLLLMDEDICGFSELEANKARKIVGKKQMELIPQLKKKIFDDAVCSKETIQYVWDTAIGVQMGYSFSLPHTVAYTVIALQELNIFNKYPEIYWNSACLMTNSGDVEDGTDYAKIAKAIGQIQGHGAEVGLVDINKSEMNFRPDTERGVILYGLKALNGVNHNTAQVIIQNRPYESLEHFIEKLDGVEHSPTKAQMVSLIKAGAFLELEGESRQLTMAKYLKAITPKRKRMTLANIPKLSEYNLLGDEVSKEFRIYEFNRFLKALKKNGQNYFLDDVSLEFYNEMEFAEEHLEVDEKNDGFPYIPIKEWEKLYSKAMEPMREYLSENKDRLIEALQMCEVIDEMEHRASGSLPRWEMDSLSFYHGKHELADVNKEKYGIVNFGDLSRDGEVERTFFAWGREIPIHKTRPIIGTVLGKNKIKASVDLLTPDGHVVLLKMNKELFSSLDRQVSEPDGRGGKKIIERTWFQRGNLLLVNGYRRDDQFIPKSYKGDPLQEVYLITGLDESGDLILKSERG